MHGKIGSYPITMADQNRRRYPHRSRTSRSRDIYPQTDIRQLPLLPPSIWIIGCGRRRWTYLDHLYKPEENMSVAVFTAVIIYLLVTRSANRLCMYKIISNSIREKNKVLRKCAVAQQSSRPAPRGSSFPPLFPFCSVGPSPRSTYYSSSSPYVTRENNNLI